MGAEVELTVSRKVPACLIDSGSPAALAVVTARSAENPRRNERRAISAPLVRAATGCLIFNRVERARLDNTGTLCNRRILLRPPVRGEIEHLVLALATEIEVEVGNDDFVRERLRLSDDPAIGID